MSTITKALALAAFVGVLGMSGFASAKTQEATHEHAAQVNRSHEQRKDAGHGYCGWTLLINPATEVAAAITEHSNPRGGDLLGRHLLDLGPLDAAVFSCAMRDHRRVCPLRSGHLPVPNRNRASGNAPRARWREVIN
jgi:hypothetical protein